MPKESASFHGVLLGMRGGWSEINKRAIVSASRRAQAPDRSQRSRARPRLLGLDPGGLGDLAEAGDFALDVGGELFGRAWRHLQPLGAAKWMADHGVPPPARGIRNTGERAMLVMPEHACGVYIGFVGSA